VAPAPALRVGVASTAPPFAFRQGEKLAGLEVDFAGALASALGRPLELREIAWEDLIPALLAGQIDVIMSGMTITPARQVRIAFSEPYLRSGLLAAIRRGESSRYPAGKSVLTRAQSIGVVANTTGDRFVREQTKGTVVLAYPTPYAAVKELAQGRLDAVIDDAPVMLWYVSSNESALSPVLDPLNQEDIGWGMRQGDSELRAAVSGVLARWRTDGTRERLLSQWIPYWTRLEDRARAR
jgi:ABC-type amino acid transport substrate-binding protein